jgi:hypothetical protein
MHPVRRFGKNQALHRHTMWVQAASRCPLPLAAGAALHAR